MSEVKMGTLGKIWTGIDNDAKSITFCVTEDCNLACKYCYMSGKNNKTKMTFETAKSTVDFILENSELFNEKSVIWEFIGGEPFLEIDLIDQISDYIKYRMFILNHPWFNSYRFSFSTNGLNYHSEKVQAYIMKNRYHTSVGISIDGNRIKHDMQRVKLNGDGSYDDVIKNVPLWLKQFPDASTKATFSHDDLPHLKDSVISLWDIGVKNVAANVVFEDVWDEGDPAIFENQLVELADYIIENELYDDCTVRFFDPAIGNPLTEEQKAMNFCGAGKMLAVDCSGNLFPCIRFLDFALDNRKGLKIGNSIDRDYDLDKLRPFHALNVSAQSKKECIECEVASGCAWCQGCNYDTADSDTIYQRSTFICDMHKANVRANKYFWTEYEKHTEKISPRRKYEETNDNMDNLSLIFITADNITPHCNYHSNKESNIVMNDELFKKGIQFCEKNNLTPILLGNEVHNNSFQCIDTPVKIKNNQGIAVYDNEVNEVAECPVCILLVNRDNVSQLSKLVSKLVLHSDRINLIVNDIENFQVSDLDIYSNELDFINNIIIDEHKKGRMVEVSVVSDLLYSASMTNCEAGVEFFALAPNGKFYLCPAIYFENPENHIGSIETGINITNQQLFDIKAATICETCDVYNCKRCKHLNKKLTGEYNVPSKIQCLISHTERNAAMRLQRKLIKLDLDVDITNYIQQKDYMDPLEQILN